MLALIIFVVLVAQNGSTKGSLPYQSQIQMFKLVSHHFLGFKLEIVDPHDVRNPIRFSALSNEYVNDCRNDPVLCPNKIIYRRQISF